MVTSVRSSRAPPPDPDDIGQPPSKDREVGRHATVSRYLVHRRDMTHMLGTLHDTPRSLPRAPHLPHPSPPPNYYLETRWAGTCLTSRFVCFRPTSKVPPATPTSKVGNEKVRCSRGNGECAYRVHTHTQLAHTHIWRAGLLGTPSLRLPCLCLPLTSQMR